jgi:hypothetical protein
MSVDGLPVKLGGAHPVDSATGNGEELGVGGGVPIGMPG